jgi:hypothetical protein
MQTAHHRALMVPHHDRISNFMGLVQPEGRTQNANVRQFYVRTEVTSAVDMLEPRDHSSQQLGKALQAGPNTRFALGSKLN